MTNKEFMRTLNTATFEMVMHTLYFNGKLWIEGNDAKKMSTPTVFDVREWLDKPFDPETEFWKYVQPEDVKKYARAGKELAEKLNKRMDWLNRNAIYGIPKTDETAYEDLEIRKLAIGIRYFFKGFIREAKNDPEIKAMIKQAVKEAYEEL